MNLAPVRGSYLESYCGASPANDMRPLQGQKRESMSGGGREGRAPILEYEPLSGAIPRTRAARQFVNSFNSLLRRLRPTNELRRSPQPRCKNSINSNLRRERPERAASSQPRATPWVSAYKHLRPVRAKVWANGWLLLLPLQGVGNGDMVPRALPWAENLLGFQPAQGRRQGFFRIIFTNLIFQF